MKKIIIGMLFFMFIAGLAAQTQTAYETQDDFWKLIGPKIAGKNYTEVRAICAAVKMYAILPAPVLAQAKYNEALMCQRLGDIPAALEGLRDVTAHHKTDWFVIPSHYLIGALLYEDGKFAGALAECDAAMAAAPEAKPKARVEGYIMHVYQLKGCAYRKMGQEAQATATFLEGINRLIHKHPDNEYLFKHLKPMEMTDEAYYGIVKKLIRAVAHDLSGLEEPSNEIVKKKVAFLKRLRTILDVKE